MARVCVTEHGCAHFCEGEGGCAGVGVGVGVGVGEVVYVVPVMVVGARGYCW